jgi:long-subunit acyl-CoA synthetase (AMP-forming)
LDGVAIQERTRVAAPQTIARLWQDATAAKRTGPAYLVQDGDEWRAVSWNEAAAMVDELAHGLLDLGVRKGDAFAILASTRRSMPTARRATWRTSCATRTPSGSCVKTRSNERSSTTPRPPMS